jgi:hypothetical protein
LTLEDLGNIGEFVGAVAVVVSLIYLALQIRQNTRQLDHNSEVVSANVELENARIAAEFNSNVANSAELAELWGRGVFGREDLTPVEETRVGFMLGDLFYRLEGLYHQHRRGFLPSDSWTPWETLMRSVLAGPLPRRWWATRAHPFSIDFTQHVDELAAHTTDPEKS